MAKSKTKYYVVWVGNKPGIYNSWAECKEQIKGYPSAKYKAFKSDAEAKKAFSESAVEHIGSNKKTSHKRDFEGYLDEIVKESISVDAACSGNPGIMEYRAVATMTGKELFRMGPYDEATNNVGEYLALVQALAHLHKLKRPDIVIYSDSRTAMAWVRNKKVKTTLKKSKKNTQVFELMARATKWITLNNPSNKVLKWETKKWGEIPADFGRK